MFTRVAKTHSVSTLGLRDLISSEFCRGDFRHVYIFRQMVYLCSDTQSKVILNKLDCQVSILGRDREFLFCPHYVSASYRMVKDEVYLFLG